MENGEITLITGEVMNAQLAILELDRLRAFASKDSNALSALFAMATAECCVSEVTNGDCIAPLLLKDGKLTASLRSVVLAAVWNSSNGPSIRVPFLRNEMTERILKEVEALSDRATNHLLDRLGPKGTSQRR